MLLVSVTQYMDDHNPAKSTHVLNEVKGTYPPEDTMAEFTQNYFLRSKSPQPFSTRSENKFIVMVYILQEDVFKLFHGCHIVIINRRRKLQ